MTFIEKYILEQARTKKMGIFGAGEMSSVAIELFERINIHNYVFFDNSEKKIGKLFKGKMILNPSETINNYFVLVSNGYFEEINRQLGDFGLKEIKDYICALDLEYYNALFRWSDQPKVPQISYFDLNTIECELKQYIEIKNADWFNKHEFIEYEQNLGFQEIYDKQNNKRYKRKIMEYYCVNKLLDFDNWNENDIYLDVGAAGSPFAKYLQENKHVKAYALDLEKSKYNELPYYIQEDATKTHFGEGEITAISMQSSFEMFVGNSDIKFIEEASRILKERGKVIICPLYLHKQYLSTVSPNYYHSGLADEGSLECIRTDCRGSLPVGRFYSVDAFRKRILEKAKCCGLKPCIYSLPQDIVEKDGFVYFKFIFVLEKC